MILLDSLFINNGGGKILLDYLVSTLEKSSLDVTYIFDDRCIGEYSFIPENRKVFMNASLFQRYLFYNKYKSRFSKIFCFGNLPPLFGLNDVKVFTYFHQVNFLETPKDFSLIEKIKFSIKLAVVNYTKHNTTLWLVQSEFVKSKLSESLGIDSSVIKVLPFYPEFRLNFKVEKREELSFLYISDGAPHKNHLRLINAFVSFFRRYKKGSLTVTVPSIFSDVFSYISSRISEGYPIKNIGFVERECLVKQYQSHEYLVYPSLGESFGLGIVEAIENGCKVIGADLPYLYQVCEPSCTFDPLNEDSIIKSFEETLKTNLPLSRLKVKNQVNEIIELLKK